MEVRQAGVMRWVNYYFFERQAKTDVGLQWLNRRGTAVNLKASSKLAYLGTMLC